MAEKKPAAAAPDPTAEMRSKLISRLAVAGGLVASLLAVLAFFDYLATPPDEPEATIYTRPVPVAPKKDISQPVTPATSLPEPPVSTETRPGGEPPPAPEVPATPVPPAVEESRPSAETPRASRKAITGKAHDGEAATPARTPLPPTRGLALPTPASPPSLPAPRAKLPETPSDVTSPPAILPPEQRMPSARVVQVQPAPAVMPPRMQRLFSGFLLQAGVFTSAQLAEELHAKLTLSGVPSTLETRVQVGPFRTRQEAEAAQEKLRELGIGSVLIPPKTAKH